MSTITDSGHSLREAIELDTGEDPVTEPAFAWSNDLPCEDCGIHDSTAVVSFDGDTYERLCFHCYVER